MKKYGGQAVAIAALLALAGCTTTGGGAPSQPEPTPVVKGMAGGLVDGAVGKGLSRADKRLALDAEYRALEYTQGGKPVSWKSASGDVTGDVVAAQPYRVGSQDCRQYTHTIFSDGDTQSARGTACRNPDGSWTPLT
jgi:surface antigen